MISSLFTDPLGLLISVAALLSAITIHECSHALAADYLGDPTPRLKGRISLNPLVHIDMFGLIFLLVAGFGWGKPVEFDPFNLKHPRRDAALISLAGPASNLILAFVLSLLFRFLLAMSPGLGIGIGQAILLPFIAINVMLALFNLLPIHPLDGFKIVGGILSRDQARSWYDLERYGMIFLLFLIVPFGGRSMLDSILQPLISLVLPLFLPAAVGGIV